MTSTDKQSTLHSHTVSGKGTSTNGVHTHTLTEVDAAIAALDARVAALEGASAPPPPPPLVGPLHEPKTDVTGVPVPAGWASGSLTLQQAIDNATAGSVLNLSAVRLVNLTATAFVQKALTVVGYGLTITAPTLVDSALAVLSDGVTLEGFSGYGLGVAQGVKPPLISGHEFGAIQLGGYWKGPVNDVVLRNLDLADGAFDLILDSGGARHQVLGCRTMRAGRSGLNGSGVSTWSILRSRFSYANTSGRDVGIDPAGVKILHSDPVEVAYCEFDQNATRGFWTDTGITHLSLHDNRWHDNDFNGAFLESSHYLDVHDNVGWRNTRVAAARTGGFSGSICFSSSDHFEAYANTDAYSGGGITVMSQSRTDDAPHVEGYIHDNTVIGDGQASTYLAGWFEDYAGVLYAPASNNRGARNRYASPGRFAWQGDKDLASYNATPGEEGGVWMTAAEVSAALTGAGIP